MLCDKLFNEIDFKTCFLLFLMFIFYLLLCCKISSQKREIKFLINSLKNIKENNFFDEGL